MRARLAAFSVFSVLLVLAVASALLVRSRAERLEHSPFARVDNGSARGLRGAWLYLQESGADAAILDAPFSAIPSGCKTVLSAGTSIRPVTRAERIKLVDWIADGGLYVYMVPRIGEQHELAKIFGLFRQHTPPTLPTGTATFEPEVDANPWLPDPLFAGVSRLRMLDDDGIFSSFPASLSIAGAGDVSILSVVPNGKGAALVVSGPDPFQNARIAKDDDLQFLANIAARGKLCIDEFHHTFPINSGPGPLVFLGPVLSQLFLCGLALAFGRGRRFGPARPYRRERYRSVNEYLREIAALFGRSHVEGELVEGLARSLRLKLATRFGISTELDDAEADRRLTRRTRIAEGRVADLLRQARGSQTTRLSPQGFAALSRKFAQLENELLV